MKTAKEILIEESKSDPNLSLLSGTMVTIERAMELYARQEAVEFLRFINDNFYYIVPDKGKSGMIAEDGGRRLESVTPEGLFESYKINKNKKTKLK